MFDIVQLSTKHPSLGGTTMTLTVREASREARVADQTMYRWIKSGFVKAVKIENTIRIPRTEFRQLMMKGVNNVEH